MPTLLDRISKTVLGDEQVPSILEQTEWETGFYEFPNQNSAIEYFNCGFVTWKDRDWLVARRRKVNIGRAGHNDLVLWFLKDNVPQREFPIRILEKFHAEHQEDPRALTQNGNLIITYCNFRHVSWAHQCLVFVGESGKGLAPYHVPYGKNGRNLMSNKGHEKNWIWFDHDNHLHFVYMTIPHVVCKTQNGKVVSEWETDNFNWLWSHGEPRGGTPPVRIGDLYYSFFHSSLKNEKYRLRYYMGAYCFRAEPPFEIVSMTTEPLLGGSQFDPRNEGAPLVVFPCGSKFDGENWLITMGVNDCRCAWIKIPHADVLERMETCV